MAWHGSGRRWWRSGGTEGERSCTGLIWVVHDGARRPWEREPPLGKRSLAPTSAGPSAPKLGSKLLLLRLIGQARARSALLYNAPIKK